MIAVEFDVEQSRTVRAVHQLAETPTADDYVEAMAAVAAAVAEVAVADGRVVENLAFTFDRAMVDRKWAMVLTAVGTARLVSKAESIYQVIGGGLS